MDKTVLTNGDFQFTTNGREIYNQDICVKCDSISMLYVYCNKNQMKGGIIMTNCCPNLYNVGLLIAAEIKGIIVTHEPTNSDELIARELIKQNNIEYLVNTHISL